MADYCRTALDVRLGFTITKGFAITFVFGVRKLVDGWDKMRLSYSPELEKLVGDISSKKIGTNFIFKYRRKAPLIMSITIQPHWYELTHPFHASQDIKRAAYSSLTQLPCQETTP